MDHVEKRLTKIEGQIEGVRKMYKQKRDCLEIAQQIAAVRSALAQVGKIILCGEAVRCARSLEKRDEFERMMEKLFSLS